jgi:hypothetical protein
MSSSLERFRSLLGHLERSRGKSRRVSKGKRRNPPAVKKPIDRKTFEGIADDSTFNRGYRPGLVPGSMRRGPNVRDIDLIGRPDRQVPGYTQPGGGRDFSGLDRPISSVKEKPGGGRNNDAKSPAGRGKGKAGRGKGKDFERMLRSRMSRY